MAKEKNKFVWKWWHVLIIIWFFTGLLEIHMGLFWNLRNEIPTLLLNNGAIQMFEAFIAIAAKVAVES
jgi:hypothetical protein